MYCLNKAKNDLSQFSYNFNLIKLAFMCNSMLLGSLNYYKDYNIEDIVYDANTPF